MCVYVCVYCLCMCVSVCIVYVCVCICMYVCVCVCTCVCVDVYMSMCVCGEDDKRLLFCFPNGKEWKLPHPCSFNEIIEEIPTDKNMALYAHGRSKVTLSTGNKTLWKEYIIGQSLGTSGQQKAIAWCEQWSRRTGLACFLLKAVKEVRTDTCVSAEPPSVSPVNAHSHRHTMVYTHEEDVTFLYVDTKHQSPQTLKFPWWQHQTQSCQALVVVWNTHKRWTHIPQGHAVVTSTYSIMMSNTGSNFLPSHYPPVLPLPPHLYNLQWPLVGSLFPVLNKCSFYLTVRTCFVVTVSCLFPSLWT